MAATGQRLAGFIGFLRDLDAVVQQVSGRPMAQHISQWWEAHGRPYLEELEARRAGADPLEADYALLGLVPGCGDEVLRAAYHATMKRCHPDRGGDAELAKKVNAAYQRIRRSRGTG